MKRQKLLTLLNDYQPVDKQEQEYKKQTVMFVKNNKDCFERHLQIGHITGSCWLLNKEGTQALLMHHAKLNRWFQLGGHADGNYDILTVAIKEAQEESGISGIVPVNTNIFDIDVHLIPANKKEPEHYHYDIRFLLQATSDEKIIQNRESKELRWISKDPSELPTSERSVTRMHEKWCSL